MNEPCAIFMPGPVTDYCAMCGFRREKHTLAPTVPRRDPFAAWRALPEERRAHTLQNLRAVGQSYPPSPALVAAAEALEALAAGRTP